MCPLGHQRCALFHLDGQEELFVQSLQNSEDRGRANVDLLARFIISTALGFLLKVFFKVSIQILKYFKPVSCIFMKAVGVREIA